MIDARVTGPIISLLLLLLLLVPGAASAESDPGDALTRADFAVLSSAPPKGSRSGNDDAAEWRRIAAGRLLPVWQRALQRVGEAKPLFKLGVLLPGNTLTNADASGATASGIAFRNGAATGTVPWSRIDGAQRLAFLRRLIADPDVQQYAGFVALAALHERWKDAETMLAAAPKGYERGAVEAEILRHATPAVAERGTAKQTSQAEKLARNAEKSLDPDQEWALLISSKNPEVPADALGAGYEARRDAVLAAYVPPAVGDHPATWGMIIRNVIPGSFVDRIGVKPGDVMTTIDAATLGGQQDGYDTMERACTLTFRTTHGEMTVKSPKGSLGVRLQRKRQGGLPREGT